VAVVTVALTLGAALPAAGTTAAAVVTTMAAGAQAASTGLTIALAYKNLEQYRTEAAAGDSALDKANAISSGDPNFMWLAIDLAAVLLELGAAKAAFGAMRTAIQNAGTTRNVSKLVAELNEIAQSSKVPSQTLEAIVGRATAELETQAAPPMLRNAEEALKRLKQIDAIPASERAQVVLDALSGGDVGAVLSNSGKSAAELVELLGKQTVAGRRLVGALTREAYNKVGPKLRALGLDDAAVARVCSMTGIDKIKGQLLEEILEIEIKQTLAASADDAQRIKLLKGAEREGTPEFIAGRRVSDAHRDQLTDGILGVLRDGASGEKEIVVIRAFEAKSGAGARRQLSMKALRSKKSRLLELPVDDQNELIKVAVDILRKRNKALARLSSEAISDSHPQELLDIIEREIPQNEWGQAHKTSQRLGLDVHPETGSDLPAQILVDGVRRRVVFPGGGGRPQVTGVLPSDLKAGQLGKTVSGKQGGKLDMSNVRGINQRQLNDLSREVGAVKGYGSEPTP